MVRRVRRLPGRWTVERALDRWYGPSFVERTVTVPDVAYFVAEPAAPTGATDATDRETDHTVLGHVSGRARSGRYGSVTSSCVAPDRWGEGVGSALFERELAALGEAGVERVELEVLAESAVARRSLLPLAVARGRR